MFCLSSTRKSTFIKLVKSLYGTTDDLEGDGGRIFSPVEHVAIFLSRIAYSNEVCITSFKLDVPGDWVTIITIQVLACPFPPSNPCFVFLASLILRP